MERRSQQKISIHITFDRAYVITAIREEDWKTVRAFLNYLGYNVRFIYVTILPTLSIASPRKIIPFPAGGKRFHHAGTRDYPSVPSA